jgi:bifunctional DNA-binding transcriptional regulator/antitoxin component of YhaV-PrlF toxin-antitoxin module
MTITKLKQKNQVTIPQAIVKRLQLKEHELFMVDVEGNYIKLTPVKIEPRYKPQELRAIDHLVEKEKGKAKVFKSGEEFSGYIKKIAK